MTFFCKVVQRPHAMSARRLDPEVNKCDTREKSENWTVFFKNANFRVEKVNSYLDYKRKISTYIALKAWIHCLLTGKNARWKWMS